MRTSSLPSELQAAEDCVARFSKWCDSSRMGRVGWMWRSVSRAAQRTCVQERKTSICNDDMDPDHATCDVRKARKCSLKQYRNLMNPFGLKAKKCRCGKAEGCIYTTRVDSSFSTSGTNTL